MTSPGGRGAIRVSALAALSGDPLPRRGASLRSVEIVRDAVVAFDRGRIVYAGPSAQWEGDVEETFHRSLVVPGFVDCHTHLPFAGWRAGEFEARIAGRSYRDLHGEGGIHLSARMLADASDDDVLAFCEPLAREMLEHGTTAFELKTGYGLSVGGELRQARLARRLQAEIEQLARVTLLPLHAVPDGLERATWVDTVCRELIPTAAGEGLADALDVYVEDIAFGLDDLERVAVAAAEAGLPLRCHAEQLGATGAAEAAVRLGARSADHLNHVSDAGVAALGRSETVAVLLPSSTAFLGGAPPPAAALLDAGAALAIATDFNPGTSPSLSMPLAIATACASYRVPPAAALVGATANPAHVLGIGRETGTLEPGKRADFVVLDEEGWTMVPYRPGHNPVRHVFVEGRRVAGRG